MVLRIEQDYNRFRKIVRGQIRKDLRKYMTTGELFAPKGKGGVSIPLPQIQVPRFLHDPRDGAGLGQGDGEEGDAIGGEPGRGQGAGNQPGEHPLEVEVSLEELAEILGEELELPRIQPKEQARLRSVRDKYSGIRSTGPDSLRHPKRTFKRALRRHLVTGQYDPENPVIIPIREDVVYRAGRPTESRQSNAAMLYIMDVSGSMGDEQKEIVRIESFWIDTWIRHNYQGVETRYIVHDAAAKEVDRETFFHIKESGGTAISSAYKEALRILDQDYPSHSWNLYVFQFSDGDNWSMEDTEECVRLLETELLPQVNLFCYGQVDSPYGSGQFLVDLKDRIDRDNLTTSRIKDKDQIYDSIKTFLGRGK